MRPARYVLLAVAAIGFIGCSQTRRLDETKRRGDRVVQALEVFRAEHGAYPAKLTELSPKYLSEIPQPVWGLKSWKYQPRSDGFDLAVDETNRTGDGDSRWLRYLGKRSGWQLGD